MKHKKQNYFPYVVGSLVLLVCILAVAFIRERRITLHLSETLKKQGAITAPYYDEKAFVKPEKIPPSGMKNHEKQIKIPIIMYHYVEYIKDISDLIRKRLDITPSLFEEQLKALKEAKYETYFVKDIPEIMDGTIHYSSQSAVLTFDDGYEDFYTDVFPLLKKYHMRATIYVIYDFIGRPGFLTAKEIDELIDSDLVEIGSHTFDHIYLKLAPKQYADRQIIDSKKKFEETFHIKVKTFAYPYGAFNADNVASVEKAGYTAAVSVIPGVMQSYDNLFFMSRIRPGVFTPQTMISVIEGMNK